MSATQSWSEPTEFRSFDGLVKLEHSAPKIFIAEGVKSEGLAAFEKFLGVVLADLIVVSSRGDHQFATGGRGHGVGILSTLLGQAAERKQRDQKPNGRSK